MSVDLGCSPAHGNGPSRLVCPSACIIGAPVQSSTLRDPRSEPGIRGEMYHPNLHGPAPPSRATCVGIGHLARQPTSEEQSSSLDDPSPKYQAGDTGSGGGVEQTRTPAQHRQAKAHSANARVAANTRTVSPWLVGRCLMLRASPLDQKRCLYLKKAGAW